jgi:hypothetical protein
MMESAATEALRLANDKVRSALNRFQSSRGGVVSIRTNDFTALRKEVLSAANCLRSVPADRGSDAELEKEISEYRTNLQQLAQILPLIHVGLQARRGRLQTALDHLQAAVAWAEASKKSL